MCIKMRLKSVLYQESLSLVIKQVLSEVYFFPRYIVILANIEGGKQRNGNGRSIGNIEIYF